MTDNNTPPTGWKFRAYGRLPWPDAQQILTTATCTWVDLDGLHLGEAPSEAPLATHLWAWSDDRCLRARFDDDTVYLAELHPDAATPGEEVHPRIGPAHLHASTPPDGPRLAERRLEMLEIPGPHPVTFLRETPPA